MKNYKIIGLTGQSGAGKSTVAKLFSDGGAAVINADLLVAKLYVPGGICLKLIAQLFGADVLNKDGSLNRPVLAQKAFSSRENTNLLNSVVHPFVLAEFLKECRAAADGGARVVVFDAPQLFECGADVICDEVVSVTADKATRLERICRRDKITEQQAQSRFNVQYDEEFFRVNSDYIIDNNGDFADTEKQVHNILGKLMP